MTTTRPDGHVYVIEFSDGTVKVGRTQNWPLRLSAHHSTAASHGVTIVRHVLSPAHRDYRQTERALITEAGRVAESRLGPERFRGPVFDALSAWIEGRAMPPSTEEDLAGDLADFEATPAGRFVASVRAISEAEEWAKTAFAR